MAEHAALSGALSEKQLDRCPRGVWCPLFPTLPRVSTHVGLPVGPSRASKDGAGCEESQLLSIQNLHFSLLCLNIHMDISAKLGEEGEGHRWRRKKKDKIWVKSKH